MSQIGTLLLSLSLIFVSSTAWAQKKEAKRWTLQEWLDTKNRNALMDQWLVMNSPSPFEFSLKTQTFSYESKEDSNAAEKFNSSSGSLSAFAGLVGLYLEHENTPKEGLNEVTGLLQFRLLGGSLQTTSLTLGVGQHSRKFEYQSANHSTRNMTGEAQLQMYITRYFGIKGTYRYYFPEDNSTLGEIYGHVTEGGLFIDFGGVRVFGDYFDDVQRMKPSGVDAKIKRHGIKTGLQFFF